MAGLQRCDKTDHFIPMLANDIGANSFSQKRGNARIGRRKIDRDKPPIREVPQSGTEAEPEHGAERKHVVSRTAGVGVVLRDVEIAAMVQQAVENIWRFMRRRRDDLDVIGSVLIGDMGIETEPGIDAITGIDIAAGGGAFPATKDPPRKNCPSELDVAPSPQTAAIGRQ